MGSNLCTVLTLCLLHAAFPACIADLPGNCIYYNEGGGISGARCDLQRKEDYDNLRQLPRDIQELECLVLEPFLEEHFSIQRFEKLRSLVLRPQNQRTVEGILSNNPGTAGIKNEVIFQGPRNLTNLSIHLSLVGVNPLVFRALVSLRVLDLSNTEGISSRDLRKLLETIGEVRPPLVTVNLTRVNVRNVLSNGDDDPISVRTDIYEPLQRIITLKILDVRNNGFVGLQGGLSQFLPQLEEIYHGENVFTFYEESIICTFIDGVVHQSLKTIFLSFTPNALRRTRRSTVFTGYYTGLMSEIQRCTLPGRHLCDIINCMCSDYFKVPCNVFSEDLFKRALTPPRDLSCKDNIQFPMPPNLERLTARALLDTRATVTSGSSWGGNFCFLPDNKLAYVDLSSSHLDFYISNTEVGAVGINNLIYLSLESNGLDLVAVAKVFQVSKALKSLLLAGNLISGNYSSSKDLFHDVPNLEVLDLSQCQLKYVPELNYLTKLTKVDLSQNMLTGFPVELTAITLRELNLSQNMLPLLPEQSRRRLDAAAENGGLLLDLTGNRILCQCHTDGFISWMQSTEVQFAGRSTMLCTYKNGVMMSPWDVNVDELRKECSNFYTIVYSVIGCLISVIISIAVALLYIKRWAIRFWIHRALETWRKRRRQIAAALENRYTFDVFVAYCSRESKERQWVHLTLVPKLENEHGM